MEIGIHIGITPMATGRGWSPGQLPGLVSWYDPSDRESLFTDDAMTVPVSADGESVAVMRDRSGNGHHMSQSNVAARPVYRTDGTRHWLEAAAGAKMSTGLYPFSEAAYTALGFQLTSYPGNYPHLFCSRGAGQDASNRQPLIFMPQAFPGRITVQWGSATKFIGLESNSVISDGAMVLSTWTESGEMTVSVGEVSGSATGVTMADGSTEGATLFGPNNFAGRFFGSVFLGRVPDAAEQAQIAAYLTARTLA